MCRTSLPGGMEGKLSLPSRGSQAATRAVLVLMFALCASHVDAQMRSLWQIGKRDNASLEFNQGWDFSQGHDPVFVVGRSDPGKDWSHIQPGPADSVSGRRVHPFTIRFDLDAAPQVTFYLVVDLFFKEPLIPAFVVDINGKKGQYLLQPRISYELGDDEMYNDIIPSTQHLRIPLPASFFHQGANQLILSCVGASGSSILPGEGKVEGESRIYYDDLALSNDPGARYEGKRLQGEAHATIFYRQGESNQLKEVVLAGASNRGRRHWDLVERSMPVICRVGTTLGRLSVPSK
jgi:alpha-mannosidase